MSGGGLGGVVSGLNNISGVFIDTKSLFGKDIKDLAVIQLSFINVVKFYEDILNDFYLSEADMFKGKRYTYKEEKGEYIYYDDFLVYNKCIYFYNQIIECRNKQALKKG